MSATFRPSCSRASGSCLMMNQLESVVAADTGGVAYVAHVGGALFDVITARLFERHTGRDSEIQW